MLNFHNPSHYEGINLHNAILARNCSSSSASINSYLERSGIKNRIFLDFESIHKFSDYVFDDGLYLGVHIVNDEIKFSFPQSIEYGMYGDWPWVSIRILLFSYIFSNYTKLYRSQGYFIVNLNDSTNTQTISWGSKYTSRLIPDELYFRNKGYETLRSNCSTRLSWHERYDGIYWRGSTTGVFPSRKWVNETLNISYFQRALFCQRVNKNSFFNCLLVPPYDQSIKNFNESFGHLFSNVRDDFMETSKYKYTIDIDGWANAWGALPKFFMGTCVLKIASPQNLKLWYYDRITPWEHYVPIA